MSRIKLSDYEFFLFFIGCFYFLWLAIPKLSSLSDLISILISIALIITAFLMLRYATKMIVSRKSIYLSLTSSALMYFSVFAFPIIKNFMSLSASGFLLIILFLAFLLIFIEGLSAKIFGLTLVALFTLLFLMQQNFSLITNIISLAVFLAAGIPVFIKMYEGDLSFKQSAIFQILLAFFLLAEIRIVMGLII